MLINCINVILKIFGLFSTKIQRISACCNFIFKAIIVIIIHFTVGLATAASCLSFRKNYEMI